MMTAEELLPTLRALLSEEPGIGFAYLFGSIAKGRTHPASDVDVAVWFDDSRPEPGPWATRATELAATLETALRRPVDVVELNRAPSALRHNVLSHGQLILSRDDAARRSFYVRHAQEWYDMEPIRRLFAEAMLRRIKEGTFGGGKGHGSQAA
jgi:predicted nucleotidyltransferase